MQEKVKNYIREKRGLKRLEFGAKVSDGIVFSNPRNDKVEIYHPEPAMVREYKTDEVEIIGLPIGLHDYLAVLDRDTGTIEFLKNNLLYSFSNYDTEVFYEISFSLETGEPASETDWKLLGEILGVE